MTGARPSRRLAYVAALTALANAGGCGTPPDPRAAPPGAVTSVPRGPAVAVAADSGATAVGVALAVPGSGGETEATAGLAHLAARAALSQIRAELASLGARADVSCDGALFTFELLAPADAWEAAAETLLDGVLDADPSDAAVERARVTLHGALTLDAASPAWQARLGVRQALYGAESSWTVPPCGVPETLALFDASSVRRAARRFRPDSATLAVVGGAAPDRVFALAARHGVPRTTRPLARRADPATAGRRYVERNTVTAWVGTAFPYPPGTDEGTLRLLGAVLEDALGPGVDRPGVFDAGYAVERHGGGGAFIFHRVVEPGSAGAAAAAAEALVSAAAAGEIHEARIERARRRLLGERLRAVASPERRAGAMARSLALGEPAPEWPAVARVGPGDLRAAAVRLGPPARAVVGPRAARPAVADTVRLDRP